MPPLSAGHWDRRMLVGNQPWGPYQGAQYEIQLGSSIGEDLSRCRGEHYLCSLPLHDFALVTASHALGDFMTEWSEAEEAKIQELMATEIVYEGCKPYKPARPEAVRMMRRLQQSGKWKPEEERVQTV